MTQSWNEHAKAERAAEALDRPADDLAGGGGLEIRGVVDASSSRSIMVSTPASTVCTLLCASVVPALVRGRSWGPLRDRRRSRLVQPTAHYYI